MTIEKVDPVGNGAESILLLNAMVALSGPNGDLAKIFGIKYGEGKTLVDVELKVNGVPVPFKAAIKEAWGQIEATIDDEVYKRALSLITVAGLDKIHNALQSAEWQIENALDKALKEINK